MASTSDMVVSVELSDTAILRFFELKPKDIPKNLKGEFCLKKWNETFSLWACPTDITKYFLIIPYFKQEDNLFQLATFLTEQARKTKVGIIKKDIPVFQVIAFTLRERNILLKYGFSEFKQDYYGFYGYNIKLEEESLTVDVNNLVTEIQNLKENTMSATSLATLRKYLEKALVELNRIDESLNGESEAIPMPEKEKPSKRGRPSKPAKVEEEDEEEENTSNSKLTRQRSARVLFVHSVDGPDTLIEGFENEEISRRDLATGLEKFLKELQKDLDAGNLSAKALEKFLNQAKEANEIVKVKLGKTATKLAGIIDEMEEELPEDED